MSDFKSGLQYDELGFLIGLKQTGRDVAKIDKNVEQIRDILLGLHKELEHQYSTKSIQPKPKLSALEQALINAQIKPVELDDLIKDKANPFVQSTVVLDRVAKSLEELIAESDAPKNTEIKIKQTKPRAVEISSTEDLVREFGNSERKRDENGRFVGSSKESQSTVRKVAQTLGAAIKDVMPSNPQGVDPTLDAINEVSTVLSPVKRAAGFMLRPLTGFMKSRKRNEPLQKEQADHNKKQVKLLQRIADNLQSKGGLLGGIGKLLGAGGGIVGGLLGSLGGLFKKGGKGLSKILKFGKGIPVIGALLTAMSFSGWDKKNTKEKGGTVGSAVGGIAGGALGSLLGPLGTIAGAAIGSWVGEKLGGIVAPYVKEWTDSLINADLPNKIFEFFSKVFSFTPAGTAVKAAKTFADWGKGVAQTVGDTVSQAWNDTVKGGEPKKGAKFGDAVNSGKLEGTTAAEKTNSLLRKHEGFSQDAYWDVNAYRIGYGSDTITDKNGNIKRVNKKSKVTKEDAERDLVRRSQQFANETRDKVGAEYWEKLPDDTKAALTSVAYNYGSLPKKVVKAVRSGDLQNISDSVRSLEVHNNGINKNRRNDEANIIKNSIIKEANKQADSKGKRIEPSPEQKVTQISNAAELLKQNVKMNQPLLNFKTPVTSIATRTSHLGASYTQPKTETTIQPAKEFLTSPKPQEVVVKNQINGTINQNVSNRLLAHAITGGLGVGDKWNV
ncbi:MAG: hypothetical protein O2793_17610 [Proteobacteria bacterium]|nr:hypothetical protein [Pseudomonadota bacterium]